jgi:hypothetical protein
MVEAALEKLRSEREARLKQRQAGPVRAVRGMQVHVSSLHVAMYMYALVVS